MGRFFILFFHRYTFLKLHDVQDYMQIFSCQLIAVQSSCYLRVNWDARHVVNKNGGIITTNMFIYSYSLSIIVITS